MRCWPKTRKIFNRLRLIQRKNVHQRSWWINVERLKQKLIIFRWMDPKQHQIIHLWYPTQRTQNGSHLRRKLYRHLRNVQESCWIIHCYVQKKSFPPLVYRRRNGRNGIHWSWIKHERLSIWILIILRCNRRRRKWSWWRRSWRLINFRLYKFKRLFIIYF